MDKKVVQTLKKNGKVALEQGVASPARRVSPACPAVRGAVAGDAAAAVNC